MLDRSTFQWPPDYRQILADRLKESERLLVPAYARAARELYKRDRLAFFSDWASTYDPRNAGVPGKMTTLPFVLFPRQKEMIEAIGEARRADAHLLIEKSRDMGATWLCVWDSIHMYLFEEGADVGWGSRKADSVDEIGVMSSIFEKIRWALRSLPPELKPKGFSEKNMMHMRITNPENGSSIIGECGDDIGRGGRTRIYFKDESAHYDHPDLIEAALGDNTRVQIDISSVSSTGNVFWRKRQAGIEWVPGMRMEPAKQYFFIMDWRTHPDKTQEWYDARKAKHEGEGTLHILAQEVDHDYSASVVGTIIPAAWIRSCVDAHLKLKIGKETREEEFARGGWRAGLDIADNTRPTGDKNAIAIGEGRILRYADDWAALDTGVTTRKAVALVQTRMPKLSEGGKIVRWTEIHYDCIGVGSGVKAEANRLGAEKLLPKGLRFVPWDAGASPLNPDDHMGKMPDGRSDTDTPLNKDFYGNLKAQGWMELRNAVWKTHLAVTEGKFFKADEMVSICSNIPRLESLVTELSQPVQKPPTGGMLFYVDKTPDGTRSPNLGDAVMQWFWPAYHYRYDTSNSWVG